MTRAVTLIQNGIIQRLGLSRRFQKSSRSQEISAMWKNCLITSLHLSWKKAEGGNPRVSAKQTVELVDILEVIYRIFQLNETSIERLEKFRKEKVWKNGAFEKIFF